MTRTNSEPLAPYPLPMSIAWVLKNLLSALLLPPGNGLLLLALAALYRRRRWAFGLAVMAGLLLLLQSLPPVAHLLIASLERQAPVFTTADGARAIVILGSGLDLEAPEYDGDTANERTLLRLRYGARLAHQLALPVLVTGGRPQQSNRAEGEVMAEILQQEFGVSTRWQETQSRDTPENARFSAPLLQAAGIRRIVLVTQAFHMPRARQLFEQAGLEVVAAPTGFKSGSRFDWQPHEWLPQAHALRTSYYALHEWLGIAWSTLVRQLGKIAAIF